MTASPNQATPRCELIAAAIHFIAPNLKHCKFCAPRACLQATEKGVPRTIEGEGEGAPIAAAARCCMPPLLLLLPAAYAHCWRMTATIARRCHLQDTLELHLQLACFPTDTFGVGTRWLLPLNLHCKHAVESRIALPQRHRSLRPPPSPSALAPASRHATRDRSPRDAKPFKSAALRTAGGLVASG